MQTLGCFDFVDWSWFGRVQDYWFLVLGAALGALTTVWWAKHEFKRFQSTEKGLSKNALLERLQFNDDRVVQILAQLASRKLTPDFTFDTTGIIIWLSRIEGILPAETVQAIN